MKNLGTVLEKVEIKDIEIKIKREKDEEGDNIIYIDKFNFIMSKPLQDRENFTYSPKKYVDIKIKDKNLNLEMVETVISKIKPAEIDEFLPQFKELKKKIAEDGKAIIQILLSKIQNEDTGEVYFTTSFKNIQEMDMLDE